MLPRVFGERLLNGWEFNPHHGCRDFSARGHYRLPRGRSWRAVMSARRRESSSDVRRSNVRPSRGLRRGALEQLAQPLDPLSPSRPYAKLRSDFEPRNDR
jgi:hypothetical protein